MRTYADLKKRASNSSSYPIPISVPCGFSKNGLPLGLQLVGAHLGEGGVLAIAHRHQNAAEWRLRHPALRKPREGSVDADVSGTHSKEAKK